MSNVDLGSQNIPPIAITRREQSIGLLREALRRLVLKRQGGRIDPPLPGRVMENALPGRGLTKKGFYFSWKSFADPHYVFASTYERWRL